MKQSIIVPNQVTTTFFNLPCIDSAHKVPSGSVTYLLSPCHMVGGDLIHACTGDILIEEDNGKWRVERNQKIKQQ